MSVEDETQHLPQLLEETLADIRELSTRCEELLQELSTHGGVRVKNLLAIFKSQTEDMGVFGEGQQSIASHLSSAPKFVTNIHRILKLLKCEIEKALLRREYEEGSPSDSGSNVPPVRSSISSFRPSEDSDAAPLSCSCSWEPIEELIDLLGRTEKWARMVQRARNQLRQDKKNNPNGLDNRWVQKLERFFSYASM
ncbi:hypothetical protein HDV64DRAFT_265247, partial [Trichoderma sp. TUCIM 5745]